MSIKRAEYLKNMTNDQVLDAFDRARGDMSYYNAGESSWHSESNERAKASYRLSEVRKELVERGLTGRPGNYLC